MSKDEMRTFISQLIQEGEQWKSMKMVVLGNGRIGKTTLLRAFDKLLDPSSIHVCSLSIISFLFFNFHIYCDKQTTIQSTIGVDCNTLDLGGGQITVWDFAGQQEYTVTHQFFLSMEVCHY